MKRVIALICVLSAMLIAGAPFFINSMVNIGYYSPLETYNDELLSESLALSLFPQIHGFTMTAEKNKELNFGCYDVSVLYKEHKNANDFDAYGVSGRYIRGKVDTDNFNHVFNMFSVKSEIIEREYDANVWSDIDAGKYYFAYFRIKNVLFENVDNYSKFISKKYNLAEWIGYKFETSEVLWGETTDNKKSFYSEKRVDLYSLFANLKNGKEEVRYFSDLKLYGNALQCDFNNLLNQLPETLPSCVMMYGTGQQILEYKQDEFLELLEIKR